MFLEVILKCRPCTHRHLNLEVLLEVLLAELEEVLEVDVAIWECVRLFFV